LSMSVLSERDESRRTFYDEWRDELQGRGDGNDC